MNCTALKELLEEFATKNVSETDCPKELDELLADTARTGVVRFSWNLLKPLLKFRLESVFKSESLCRPSDKSKEDEDLSQHLLKRLDLFDNPPFTIQRICELVMNPRQHYKRRDKYMRAMEKNLMVVGTQSPDLTWMKSPRLTQLLEEKTNQLSNHTNSTATNAIEHPSQSHLDHSPKGAGEAPSGDRPRNNSSSEEEKEGLGRVLQEADSTTLDHGTSDKTATSNASGEETPEGNNKESAKMECDERPQAAAKEAVKGEEPGRPVLRRSEVEDRAQECAAMDVGGSVAVLETGQYVAGMDDHSSAPSHASGEGTGGSAPLSGEQRALGGACDIDKNTAEGAKSDNGEESGEQPLDNVSGNGKSDSSSKVEEKTDANGNISTTPEIGQSGSCVSVTEELTLRKDEVSMETGETSTYEPATEKESASAGGNNAGSAEEGTSEEGVAYDVVEGGATLKVADEGEWVVVELGGGADKSANEGTRAAEGSEESSPRASKRLRSESDVEDKSSDEAEPVVKQSRLEEDEEEEVGVSVGVVGELPEESPRVQGDPELRPEEMDATEEPESSYKEAATGQVEKVEGEDTTTNGN